MNRNLAERLLPIATINRTSAETIACSITEYGIETRLDSIYCVFPKMVLGERNRHRGFSLSDRSSRAVPPEKLIAEVRSGERLAMPAKFRRRTKGMGGGEDLVGDELIAAQLRWIEDGLDASDAAERAMDAGEEKETVNRRLDMFIYMHSLQTATRAGWLNWLGLRLANASPTIEVVANRTFQAYKAAIPKLLLPGEWHLPFVDRDEVFHHSNANDIWTDGDWPGKDLTCIEIAKRLSAARCAHLSYNDLETGRRMAVDRALSIYDKLVASRPLHASPIEHQATPDARFKLPTFRHEPENPEANAKGFVLDRVEDGRWQHPEQHGNLYGWRQARKMIPGEAVAALPEGYIL